MNALELGKLIQRTVLVPVGNLQFRATVIDARFSYGKARVLVQPESGQGTDWKNLDAVTLLPLTK